MLEDLTKREYCSLDTAGAAFSRSLSADQRDGGGSVESSRSCIYRRLMDVQDQQADASAGDEVMEEKREKEKRTSRACLACRKRKSACHL